MIKINSSSKRVTESEENNRDYMPGALDFLIKDGKYVYSDIGSYNSQIERELRDYPDISDYLDDLSKIFSSRNGRILRIVDSKCDRILSRNYDISYNDIESSIVEYIGGSSKKVLVDGHSISATLYNTEYGPVVYTNINGYGVSEIVLTVGTMRKIIEDMKEDW